MLSWVIVSKGKSHLWWDSMASNRTMIVHIFFSLALCVVKISRVYDVKTSVIARNVNLWPANLEYLTRTNTKHIFNSATIVCISGSLGSHQNILVLSACRHTRDFATHPQMMYLHSLPWHIHKSTLGNLIGGHLMTSSNNCIIFYRSQMLFLHLHFHSKQ
jgi:hypothetical protein